MVRMSQQEFSCGLTSQTRNLWQHPQLWTTNSTSLFFCGLDIINYDVSRVPINRAGNEFFILLLSLLVWLNIYRLKVHALVPDSMILTSALLFPPDNMEAGKVHVVHAYLVLRQFGVTSWSWTCEDHVTWQFFPVFTAESLILVRVD